MVIVMMDTALYLVDLRAAFLLSLSLHSCGENFRTSRKVFNDELGRAMWRD